MLKIRRKKLYIQESYLEYAEIIRFRGDIRIKFRLMKITLHLYVFLLFVCLFCLFVCFFGGGFGVFLFFFCCFFWGGAYSNIQNGDNHIKLHEYDPFITRIRLPVINESGVERWQCASCKITRKALPIVNGSGREQWQYALYQYLTR